MRPVAWTVAPGDRRALSVLLLVFALSRVGYAALGLHFDDSGLVTSWQLLDPALLRTDLLGSVYRLHSQPPLFNLFVGSVLQAAGSSAPVLFHSVFVALSLVCGVSLYGLLRVFGLRPASAGVLTGVYLVSPTAAVYENWLFYTWPMAALLTLSAILFYRLVQDTGAATARRALALFSVLAVVSLTRSLYPLPFVVLVLGACLLVVPRRRAVLAGALVPVLLVAGWSVKNEILFGTFASSSWGGMGIARVVDASLGQRQRGGRYERTPAAEVDSLSEVPPFAPPEVYERILGEPQALGHPALDAERKSTGEPNYNQMVYLEAAPLYAEAALDSVRVHPAAYVRQVVKGVFLFSRPATDYFLVAPLADEAGWLNVPFDTALYGNLAWVRYGPTARLDDIAPALQVGWLVLLALGLVAGRAAVGLVAWVRRPDARTPSNATLLYAAALILYTAIIGCAFEYGENERFRVNTEPLLYATAVASVWAARQRRVRLGEKAS